MNNYNVEITRSVEKDLDDLQNLRAKTVQIILTLEKEPLLKTKALSGNLKGLRSFKFQVNNNSFRAIFKIYKEKKVCLLILIGSRQNIYKQAARRVKRLKKDDLL